MSNGRAPGGRRHLLLSGRTTTARIEPDMTDTPATETPATETPAAETPAADSPASEAVATGARPPSMINVRNLSVKCGHCGEYQVLTSFAPIDEDWNLYTYECDWPPCNDDPSRSRTLLEVPSDLDEFARRDPGWRGGKKHAGAEPPPE